MGENVVLIAIKNNLLTADLWARIVALWIVCVGEVVRGNTFVELYGLFAHSFEHFLLCFHQVPQHCV